MSNNSNENKRFTPRLVLAIVASGLLLHLETAQAGAVWWEAGAEVTDFMPQQFQFWIDLVETLLASI